jgi:hypothetical protein
MRTYTFENHWIVNDVATKLLRVKLATLLRMSADESRRGYFLNVFAEAIFEYCELPAEL